MRFSDLKNFRDAGSNCFLDFAGMETPMNAEPVGISDDFLEQLFSMPVSSGCDSGTDAMPLWPGSGVRCDTSTAGDGGFRLGFNLDERRGMFVISEEGDGSENRFLEEADAKPYTEGEYLVHLPTSKSLAFGNVQSHQIRPNNPPQVLKLSRLGGASAVLQFMADISLQLIELNGDANDSSGTKQQMWERKSNDGTELKGAKLMEEGIGTPIQFLQPKVLCIMRVSLATTIVHSHNESTESCALTLPEPDAPL